MSRTIILMIVAVVITFVVYGVVALIVKMDDVGLHLATTGGPTTRRLGRNLVAGMPKVLAVLATVGTAAMLWVGGHLLLVGADELGWHWPYKLVHDIERPVEDVPALGGVLAWLVNTVLSAVGGLVVGLIVLWFVLHLPAPARRLGAQRQVHS